MDSQAGSFGRNLIFDALVRATQDLEAIERIATTVQPAVSRMLGDERHRKSRVANFLHGTWMGHPLHPILTDVPIGAFLMAALFDGAAALTKRRDLLPAADICVATGFASALATAVTGLADWSQTSGRPARIGVLHASFNIAATTLYGSAAFTRKKNRPLGTALTFAGFSMAMIGASLGGHLVFGEQIGVNHATFDDLPTDFRDVLDEGDLPENRPHKATFEGRDVMLLRRGDEIFALLDTCAHLGGPLCEGRIEADSVRCPWHGSRFRLRDGMLLDGPATSNQPAFDARLHDGKVQLRAREAAAP